jgi:hypothetical protein
VNFVVPFTVIPLTKFMSSELKMGPFKLSKPLEMLCWFCSAVAIVLNMMSLYDFFSGLEALPSPVRSPSKSLAPCGRRISSHHPQFPLFSPQSAHLTASVGLHASNDPEPTFWAQVANGLCAVTILVYLYLSYYLFVRPVKVRTVGLWNDKQAADAEGVGFWVGEGFAVPESTRKGLMGGGVLLLLLLAWAAYSEAGSSKCLMNHVGGTQYVPPTEDNPTCHIPTLHDTSLHPHSQRGTGLLDIDMPLEGAGAVAEALEVQ